MSGEERLVAEIPSALKSLVDSDPRTNKEIVESALWNEFGGFDQASIERRIDETKQRISMIESERNERQRELNEQQEALERLEAKLDNISEDNTETIQEAAEHLKIEQLQPDNKALNVWADKTTLDKEEFIKEVEACL